MNRKCSCCKTSIEYNKLEDLILKECPNCKATLMTVKEYRIAKATRALNELSYMVFNKEKPKEQKEIKTEEKINSSEIPNDYKVDISEEDLEEFSEMFKKRIPR